MKPALQQAFDAIILSIDDATTAEFASLEEALDFFEELAHEIQCRIDGIEDDLEDGAVD